MFRLQTTVSSSAIVILLACGRVCSAQTAAAPAPQLEVLACPGPASSSLSTLPLAPGASLITVEHASASPCGGLVVVGRVAVGQEPVRQVTWVRDSSGRWTERLRSGVTPAPEISGAVLDTLRAAPVLNNCGDLLTLAAMSGQSAPGPSQPVLVTLKADAPSKMNLRFGASSGVGVPPTGMVNFSSPQVDAWRMSDVGPTFVARARGLYGLPIWSQSLQQFTALSTENTAPGTGTAMLVGAFGDSAVSPTGYAVQSVGSTAYGADELAGLVVFDPWGIGSFAVRHGTTPIANLPGQFVLSTSAASLVSDAISINSTGSRLGINASGVISFLGTFGAPGEQGPDVITDLPPNGGPVPIMPPIFIGPSAVFAKAPGQGAMLLARAGTPDDSNAPGLPGWQFGSFGSPMINARGQVVFTATLFGPTDSRNSIWVAEPDATLRLIAVTRVTSGPGAPPATLGGSFQTFTSEPSINASGQVLFQARLANAASSEAVIGFDPSTGLTPIVRTGQQVTLPDGTFAAISLGVSPELDGRTMLSTGNQDGLPTLLTDTGRVVKRVSITGRGTGVVSATIPSIAGACCAGSVCLVSTAPQCSGANRRFRGAGTACLAITSAAASCCSADFDQNRTVTVQDLFSFIAAWSAQDSLADIDQSGSVGVSDLIAYIGSFVSGCPSEDSVTIRR